MTSVMMEQLVVARPTRWNAAQVRRVARVLNGGTPSSDPENWDGDIPFVTPPDLRGRAGDIVATTGRKLTAVGATSGSTVADAGVVVSNRAPIGYVGRLDAPSAFNQGCKVLRPDAQLQERYLAYCMVAVAPVLQELGQGTTFMELSSQSLGSLYVPLPPLAEQRAIADYLDRETAKIDALIEKQTKLIDRLRERRSTFTAHIIEKQQPFRVNGPRLRHHVRGVRQGWSPQCNNWPAETDEWAVLRAGCTNRGVFDPYDNKQLPEGTEPRPDTVVRDGDLVVGRANTRDLVGGAAVVRGTYPRLMLSDKLYAYCLRGGALPEYVAAVLGTQRYRDMIGLAATGASYSMQNICQRDIADLPMSLPSLEVQVACVKQIDDETARIDALIAKSERFIELARERRSALITAAVTGQIDVTEGAA